MSLATRLVNCDADNYLPIVYISRSFNNGIEINPFFLAKSLGGLAHIILEPSREFSRRLQISTEGRNVYGGHVGIYWPDGVRHLYSRGNLEHDSQFRKRIVSDLRSAILHRRPLRRCAWSTIEAQVARFAIQNLRSSGSNELTDYIVAFDVEMKAKAEQIAQADQEILQLREQLRRTASQRVEPAQSVLMTNEQELVDGEFNTILAEALDDSISRVPVKSRRAHVLTAFRYHIVNNNKLQERRKLLKESLRNYRTMTKPIQSALEELGFSISDDGKHYKLIYLGDPRYTFPLPKTGSDHRGGLNAASDIGKNVF